ncbi:MAG: TPR repeat protein [Gammaproteobacteria bacterium]|jgi:TPR repeat protein
MIRLRARCLLLILICFHVAASDSEDADLALMRGDYRAAISVLETLAGAGDSTAMVRLAALYHGGEGVPRDVEKAADLYLGAAELGNAEAQFNLGNMYLLGEGFPEDQSWALTFYRLASKQGHALATANMEEMIRAGIDSSEPDDLLAHPASDDAASQEVKSAGIPGARKSPSHNGSSAEPSTDLPDIAADTPDRPFAAITSVKTLPNIDPLGEGYQSDSKIVRANSTNELQNSSDARSATNRNEMTIPDVVAPPIEPVVIMLTSDEVGALKLAEKHGISVDLKPDSAALDGPRSQIIDDTRTGEVPDAEDDLRNRFEQAQISLQEDQEQGLVALKELADDGYADSAMLLAELASRDTSPKSLDDAAVWLRRAAVLGHAEAQYRLAEQYMHGTQVVEDEAMAITFYRDVALGGHDLAKEKLHAIYARAGLPAPDLSRPPHAPVPAERVRANPLSVESHNDQESSGEWLPSSVERQLSSGEASALDHVVDRSVHTEIELSEMEIPSTLSARVGETLDATVRQEMSPPVGTREATVLNLVGDSSSDIFSTKEARIRPAGDQQSAEVSESKTRPSLLSGGFASDFSDRAESDLASQAVSPNVELPALADRIEQTTMPPNAAPDGQVPEVEFVTNLDDAKQALANRQFTVAAELFTQLANVGDAAAQAHLGYLYLRGEGVEKNLGVGIDWYRRAAALGNRDAQYNLGVAYAFGEGVAQSDVEAVNWYRRAAELGSPVAQFSLGISYALGEGVARDDEQSQKWYRAAAESGYAAAQYNLGYGYRTGSGTEPDNALALQWFLAAANNGHASAQYSLGYMYRSRRGVARNIDEAVRWYKLAAAQGHLDAHADLASLVGSGAP